MICVYALNHFLKGFIRRKSRKNTPDFSFLLLESKRKDASNPLKLRAKWNVPICKPEGKGVNQHSIVKKQRSRLAEVCLRM